MASENKIPHIFEHINEVDISEQDIYDYSPEVLDKLLIDHTMSAKVRAEGNDSSLYANIFWATSDYEDARAGEEKDGYRYKDQIRPESIIGKNSRVIMPRVLKEKQLQLDRTKEKAEVFTPSWVCNAQNNLIDEAWFGRNDVFNKEVVNEDGTHTWVTTEGKIEFPEDEKNKTWKKYVTDTRMEITCGEAPYLVSRYDTTTGVPIPLKDRIGLLDRKLRVVNENVSDEKEWYDMAEKAMKNIYGYEWQGDNLLLAREALLYTYIEYFIDRFNRKDENGEYIRDEKGLLKVPTENKIINAARWISWNIWQMDGLKMVVPDTCHEVKKNIDSGGQKDLFSDEVTEIKATIEPCPGCATDNIQKHNGVYCIIRDWSKSKPKNWKTRLGVDPHSQPWQKIEFRTLLYPKNPNEITLDDRDAETGDN